MLACCCGKRCGCCVHSVTACPAVGWQCLLVNVPCMRAVVSPGLRVSAAGISWGGFQRGGPLRRAAPAAVRTRAGVTAAQVAAAARERRGLHGRRAAPGRPRRTVRGGHSRRGAVAGAAAGAHPRASRPGAPCRPGGAPAGHHRAPRAGEPGWAHGLEPVCAHAPHRAHARATARNPAGDRAAEQRRPRGADGSGLPGVTAVTAAPWRVGGGCHRRSVWRGRARAR